MSKNPIHQTYALRWQIELVFKLSQSLVQVDSINSTKSPRVRVETYGKFISRMLLVLLCAPARAQQGIELSGYKACKLFIIQGTDLSRALASTYRLKLFIKSFFESLMLFARKDIKKKKNLENTLSNRERF